MRFIHLDVKPAPLYPSCTHSEALGYQCRRCSVAVFYAKSNTNMQVQTRFYLP